jgi:hypothetical protein
LSTSPFLASLEPPERPAIEWETREKTLEEVALWLEKYRHPELAEEVRRMKG